MIEFRMLGSLGLSDGDGVEIRRVLAQPHRLALLAFFAGAAPQRLHRRDSLLALFWPELDAYHARAALRQALHVLRRSLGDGALLSRGDEEVGLDFSRVWCDVDAFDRAVAAGRLAEALELYRGDLLDGFFVAGAPDFDQWLETRRSTLRASASRGAITLADQCERGGDVGVAAIWARRALQMSPCDEGALRRLVTLLDHQGDRAGAERAFHDFEQQLARVLDSRPSFETETLIASVRSRQGASPAANPPSVRQPRVAAVTPRRAARATVGREHERAELVNGFRSALAGRSRVLCVAGEPGIGKTTLVEEFLTSLAASGEPCRIARGRCSERLAGAEAYLPVLQALRGLLDTDIGGKATTMLERSAPTWYRQLAQPPANGAAIPPPESREALKLELSAFCEAVSRELPLVIFFDDVHWADASTIGLLAHLSSRFGEIRALVILAYRPAELLTSDNGFVSVRLDLQSRGLGREVELPFLTREQVAEYLAHEFPDHAFPATFPSLLYDKTEGSPLFVVDVVHYLRDRDVIARPQGRWRLAKGLPAIERDLPDSVRSMIERKLGQLSAPDRRLLVAASVQGQEFDSAVMAQVLGAPTVEIEERLRVMDHQHGVVRAVREERLRDRSFNVRCRFVHVLYQNALYETLVPSRKAELSEAVAGAILALRGDGDVAIASELALLYEVTRDGERAAAYFLRAAEHAARLFAYQEASALAARGIDTLLLLPDTPDRSRRELPLQIALSLSLMGTKGWGTPEVRAAYGRAQALCEQVGEATQISAVLAGRWRLELLQANLSAACGLAEQLLDLAPALDQPALRVQGHLALAYTLNHLGRHADARQHAEHGIAAYDVRQQHSCALLFAQDPGVECYTQLARALWVLGYPDQALVRTREAVALAEELSQPSSQAWAHLAASLLHQLRREAAPTLYHSQAALQLSADHGLVQTLVWAKPWHGWALAHSGRVEEGIAEMRDGLAGLPTLGTEVTRPQSIAVLAETLAEAGEVTEALGLVAEALRMVERSGAAYYGAELLRLEGEFHLLDGGAPDACKARDSFLTAIGLAREHQAKSFELRATSSLARLLRREGNTASALRLLEPVMDWFTEGLNTPDCLEGRSLITSMSDNRGGA